MARVPAPETISHGKQASACLTYAPATMKVLWCIRTNTAPQCGNSPAYIQATLTSSMSWISPKWGCWKLVPTSYRALMPESQVTRLASTRSTLQLMSHTTACLKLTAVVDTAGKASASLLSKVRDCQPYSCASLAGWLRPFSCWQTLQ